jgi:hypothetical protein
MPRLKVTAGMGQQLKRESGAMQWLANASIPELPPQR